MSIRELARYADVSASLISQVENGKTDPSIATLRRLASALNAPIASLFVAPDRDLEAVQDALRSELTRGIVRRKNRKHLFDPRRRIRYELLTPDLNGAVELVWVELEPDHPRDDLRAHSGEEVILVIEGRLRVRLEYEVALLEPGDSIRFDGSIPHAVENAGNTKCIHVGAVSPPGF